MLLPDSVHPEQSIYYNGAFVLKSLQDKPNSDFLDLFQSTRELCEMTLPVFVLCLDWLYLLGIAKFDQQGRVELCS